MISSEISSGHRGLRVSFYGGAGKVTGSNFLVEDGETRILVDCGIEQGKDFCESCTYDAFPYDVSSVDALVVTHAHLDHVGRIPKLAKDGFRGKIYLTPPSRDLAELILRDSVGILKEEAARRNLPPPYEDADVSAAFSLVETLSYHEERAMGSLSFILRNTGHILGSASVRIRNMEGIAVAFTGDIGNIPSPFLPDWEAVPDADVLIMESVYGDRLHPARERRAELREVLKTAIAKGGAILIPAFSMERTQLMLYELSNFMAAKEIPDVKVFLDSPLAIAVTDVYRKYAGDYFKPDAQKELAREGALFGFPLLTKTRSREESEKKTDFQNPKIIIAGAGMSHGGRIGHHEARHLPDPRSTLLIVGYQAPGSPGRLLQDGARQIHIGGRDISVRATIETLSAWSAHADRDGLLAFAEACLPRPKVIFAALGEPSASRFLAQRIHDFLGARAVVPQMGEAWKITKETAQRI